MLKVAVKKVVDGDGKVGILTCFATCSLPDFGAGQGKRQTNKRPGRISYSAGSFTEGKESHLMRVTSPFNTLVPAVEPLIRYSTR